MTLYIGIYTHYITIIWCPKKLQHQDRDIGSIRYAIESKNGWKISEKITANASQMSDSQKISETSAQQNTQKFLKTITFVAIHIPE